MNAPKHPIRDDTLPRQTTNLAILECEYFMCYTPHATILQAGPEPGACPFGSCFKGRSDTARRGRVRLLESSGTARRAWETSMTANRLCPGPIGIPIPGHPGGPVPVPGTVLLVCVHHGDMGLYAILLSPLSGSRWWSGPSRPAWWTAVRNSFLPWGPCLRPDEPGNSGRRAVEAEPRTSVPGRTHAGTGRFLSPASSGSAAPPAPRPGSTP